MKTAERERARELRREHGASVREIATCVGVSRSTVSLWVRDIPLTAEQEAALVARNARSAGKAICADEKRRRALARRRAFQEEGRELAIPAEPGFAAGCMLFWAEGSRSRNSIEFVNSDPVMVEFFAKFLRRYLGVETSDIKIACNLFADHVERQREIEDFWLERLGLPRSSLRKTMVNVYSKHSKKLRKNKLPYGTCKLVVADTRLVQMLYGAIQELAGFDRDEWATM
jgi:transcriptional regulator with XRE-family HTH domain